jgi:hypothetical protein
MSEKRFDDIRQLDATLPVLNNFHRNHSKEQTNKSLDPLESPLGENFLSFTSDESIHFEHPTTVSVPQDFLISPLTPVKPPLEIPSLSRNASVDAGTKPVPNGLVQPVLLNAQLNSPCQSSFKQPLFKPTLTRNDRYVQRNQD